MDKIKKNQFWIITGLAVLLGTASYWMTSSKLNKLYSDQSTALDGKFTDVSSTEGKISTHPNDFSNAKMQLIIDSLAKDVQAAWQNQYERQAPLLQWPDALHNKRLIDKLKSYTPIETSLIYPEEPAKIVVADKRAYARYFDEQMPRIVNIIGTKWVGKASETAQGSAFGMPGSDIGYDMGSVGSDMMGADGAYGTGMQSMLPRKPTDLVIWPKSSQDELITSIRLWQGDTPSVYQILYTQENMWILEGIMNIIATTNQGAIENFQTAIKEIEFIRIGKSAVSKAGVIDPPKKAGGTGYGSMEGSMDGGMDGGMDTGFTELGDSGSSSGDMYAGDSGSGTSDDGYGSGAPVVVDPANGRYVDATFAPLTGDDLRSKTASEAPEDAYFAVAKRIPVRLRFKMDQRRIPKLLANCGNADLMFEVRQVRIGDTTAAAVGSSAYGGMGAMGGMGMGSDLGGYGGGGSGSDMYGSGADIYGSGSGDMYGGGMGGMGSGGMMGLAAKPTWEMPVEIYGVVYLYNPVSIKRLGLDKVTGETEVEDTVENPDTSSDIVPTQPATNAATPTAGDAAPENVPKNPAATPGPAATQTPDATVPAAAPGQ